MASKMQWVLATSDTDPCCCESEPDCCMYPAAGLGDTYEAADLPDFLTMRGRLGEYKSIPKLDPPESGRYYFLENYGEWISISLFVDEYDGTKLWRVQGFFDEGDEYSFDTECLITGDGNLEPGDDSVEDQFADCYEVEIVVGDRAGTYTVIRRSLCDWSSEVEDNGEPAGVKLYYLNELGAPIWEIDFSVGYRKDGNSSSPEGEYQGGDAIVTEC